MSDLLLWGVPKRRVVAGFSPADISNLESWFESTQITGLVDNDPVTTWADLSGNGRDLTQATVAAKPTYKTNVVVGNPTVRTDGVNDFMRQASFGPITQPATLFFAGRLITNDVKFVFDGAGGTNRWYLYSDVINWHYGTNTANLTDGAANAAFHVHIIILNGAGAKNYVDGGAAASTDNSGSAGTSGLSFAVSFIDTAFSNTDGVGLGFYSKALSLAEINQLGPYLAAKVGTTWTTAT